MKWFSIKRNKENLKENKKIKKRKRRRKVVFTCKLRTSPDLMRISASFCAISVSKARRSLASSSISLDIISNSGLVYVGLGS